jgi:hypothetical protein
MLEKFSCVETSVKELMDFGVLEARDSILAPRPSVRLLTSRGFIVYFKRQPNGSIAIGTTSPGAPEQLEGLQTRFPVAVMEGLPGEHIVEFDHNKLNEKSVVVYAGGSKVIGLRLSESKDMLLGLVCGSFKTWDLKGASDEHPSLNLTMIYEGN